MNGELAWHKSSVSDNQGGACVEVAVAQGVTYVRDSKVTAGPRLTVGPAAWNDLLSATARDLTS